MPNRKLISSEHCAEKLLLFSFSCANWDRERFHSKIKTQLTASGLKIPLPFQSTVWFFWFSVDSIPQKLGWDNKDNSYKSHKNMQMLPYKSIFSKHHKILKEESKKTDLTKPSHRVEGWMVIIETLLWGVLIKGH